MAGEIAQHLKHTEITVIERVSKTCHKAAELILAENSDPAEAYEKLHKFTEGYNLRLDTGTYIDAPMLLGPGTYRRALGFDEEDCLEVDFEEFRVKPREEEVEIDVGSGQYGGIRAIYDPDVKGYATPRLYHIVFVKHNSVQGQPDEDLDMFLLVDTKDVDAIQLFGAVNTTLVSSNGLKKQIKQVVKPIKNLMATEGIEPRLLTQVFENARLAANEHTHGITTKMWQDRVLDSAEKYGHEMLGYDVLALCTESIECMPEEDSPDSDPTYSYRYQQSKDQEIKGTFLGFATFPKDFERKSGKKPQYIHPDFVSEKERHELVAVLEDEDSNVFMIPLRECSVLSIDCGEEIDDGQMLDNESKE